MQTVAEYEAWKAKQRQAQVKSAAFIVGQADGNPDQLAGDLQIATDFSAATGNPTPPAPMVGQYRSVFQAAIDKTRAETILARSPRLTDWLRNPENATLAKDDLESLSFWESTALIPRNVAAGLGPRFAGGFYNALGTVAALPGDNAASKFLFDLADDQAALGDAIAGPSGGWATQQIAGAAQSIGLMVPGLALTALSGGTTTPGLAAAFIAPGAITEGGQSARQAMDAGLSPARSLAYGGLNATAEVMFERIPVGRFLGDLAEGAGFGKILLGQIGTEVPTEVATTLFQNLNQWVTLNPDKPLTEFVAEQPAAVRDTIAQTLLATIGLSGIGAGVARVGRFAEDQAKAKEAEARVTMFQELSGQAVASKLRARMPDRFRQFVERATQNGPVENVYVPASEFAGYFQSAGIDPYAVVDQLEGVTRDDLDAALAGGADLKIPTATYAANIAGSEHDAFLMENMRFDPMDMTAREAAEFNARADEIMQEMWAEAEDIRLDEERWRAVEEKIHDEVVSRLRIAGLSTERAMAEVQPIVAFYRTRAARMGLTTEEYLAKNPLPGIQGSIPQGMQFKSVDELNRTLAEARRYRGPAKDTRQSLLEFISERGGMIDPGGELKARDAEVVSRGRGRKALRLARDPALRVSSASAEKGRAFGADDVAQAAIEAGFMADNPLVIEYKRSLEEGGQAPDITRALWDAIDAELAGEKQASEFDAAPVDQSYLDEIEAYLDRLGLDLSNTDEEIRAAIEADQAGGDRMYGQARGGFDMSRGGGSKTVKVGDTTMIYGISSDGTSAEIISVRTSASKRGQGSARQAIASFLMETDALGMTVNLAASPLDKKTKLGSLVSFYESLGFVRTGRAINAAGDPEMVRSAQKSYSQDGALITDSAAFKAWFGDSKVVDADGKPLVVYHGTAADFEAFRADGIQWFTNDRLDAQDYQPAKMIEAYLSIRNPADLDSRKVKSLLKKNDIDVENLYELTQRGDEVKAILISAGYDGVAVSRPDVDQGVIHYAAFAPTQIKSVFNRGTFDPTDARILYQDGAHPFAGFTREQFLGNPKITSDSNASTLKPRAFQSLDDVEAVPFAAGRGLVAKYDDASAAVFDGDKVIASYNFGDTLVVDKKYRRQGIGEELVYQWRMRNPQAKTATHRTKASQRLQEKVWDRIRQEVGASRTYNQPAYHGTPHLFEKFSLSAIGTGEGAQAFGWGLYFAGRKEVAEHYRGALADRRRVYEFNGSEFDPSGLSEPERFAFDLASNRPGKSADELLNAMVDEMGVYPVEAEEYLPFLQKYAGNVSMRDDISGRLFQVEIPEDNELLDWDAPLKKQPASVKEKLKPLIEELRSARMNEYDRKEILSGKANGDLFYKAYSQYLATKNNTGTVNNDRAASEALRAAGIPGHRYLDGGSRADGQGSRNYVIYDDSRVQVSSFEQNQSGPRGSIQFNMDGSSLIRLFETANLSTVQHEMGHLFLTMLQRDAATGDAATVAEYEIIKGWWRENAAAVASDGNRAMPDAKLTADDVQRAIDIGTTGDMMKDAAIDVGMQEQWARGYEAYLMEGKAPSVELRSVFAKFRSWLISVYKSLRGLNVQINDDIRGVFDRMLATDEQIAQAQAASGERSVFTTAEQMGLTQEEFERFQKLRVQAEDEAKARLQIEIMEPIKRQREQWWKDETAKVTEEVTRQVNALPVFRALEWLGNRRWLGDGQPEDMPDMRLSKSTLVDRYGEGVLSTLPRGKFTIYTVEGGMDPDAVAGWFGFESGDAMIRALERAPGRKDAIKAEVDRVMYQRHGDALKDGEIEKIALDALHSDRRGEWMAVELEAVRKIVGEGVGLTYKETRATAKQTIAGMKVRDATAANRFLAAERKAGEEAYRLAGTLSREGYWENRAKFMASDPQGRPVANKGQADMVARLYSAKRRQMMNHALYMEARAAVAEVEKAERYVARLNKSTMREKIAGAGRRENAQVDYLGAIDEILDRYDFRKLSGRAEVRRGALLDFVEKMKAAGRENELAIPARVLSDAAKKPYKTLTVEELRGVVDSLKNLQHVALRWNELIDAQNQRALDEAVADITAAMDANLPKRPPGRVKTAGEGLRNSVRQFLDLVLNATTLLREIDGFKDGGPAYSVLKAPIDAAMDRLTVRKEKAAADIEALYAVYSKEDRRKMAVRKVVPGLPYSLSKWEMIAVALNTGNEGNMQRLTDPKVRGHLTEAQVKAVLANLDARDADFVQSVWDYVGSFRDDIAARERRTTGVEPAWVDPSPVTIAGKTLRGGYYPLKYDPRLSSLARDDEAQAIGEALQAGRFGKAQTKRGHLEARAQSSGRAIELDMSVFHRHVNQVIYDLELSEPVANSWKVLQNGQVRGAFMDAGRQADFDALETWLKDTAEGQLAAGDWINKNARRLKSNFTAAKLAFNLGSVMAQVTGLSQTMVVVGKRDFVRGLQASFRPGVADEIAAKSAFMRQRQTTFNKDISDFYSDPSLGPTASRWGDIKREWIGPASFWLMTKVQWGLVDIPTWMGGYQQGLRMFGGDEAKAIAHADGIVKRAQSSGLFSDRSAIERGSVSRTTRQNDVVRLFTTLGSYMFAKFNVAYERAAVGGRVIRQEGFSIRSAQEAASLTMDLAFLFTLEAIVMAALKGGLPGEDDDEDGDGMTDEWAAFLARETSFSVLGTIPFVRDVASFTQGFEGGGAYGGIISEVGKPFVEIGQGEVDKGFVKSVIAGTGLAFGLPSTQINRAVDAGWRQVEGEDVSPLEYLLGKRAN